MSELPKLIEWSNSKPGKIANPEKAEYMARVEDKWRSSIANLVRTAVEDPELRESAMAAAKYQAVVFGPSSVEAAGKVWDEFYHPVLPPTLEKSLKDRSYATGSRQYLE
jgi:hypothetical protein